MQFEPVSLSWQDVYLNYFVKMQEKPSDLSFVNIFGWAEEYGLQIIEKNNFLWLKQTSPTEIFWPPVGDWEVEWNNVLTSLPFPVYSLERVPGSLAFIWEKQFSNIRIIPQREHWDYVYLVKELIELSGNRFHKKKNLLNQFFKKYNYVYKELQPKDSEEVLTLQTEWCLWKECADSKALEAENKAIFRVLSSWEQLKNLFGGAIWINNQMVAYTIAEPLDHETLVIHFEKGCPKVKGIYQAINYLFLKNSADNFKFVNREQDLGDIGLRKAKKSYNPYGYVKKYKVDLGLS
ncbi:DUF2156 domain-containing protein [Desulfonauticus submarinus]